MKGKSVRNVLFPAVLPLILAVLLAGCSGGGTAALSSSSSGSTVTVSLATAPPNSAGTLSVGSAVSPADLLKKPAPAGNIDNAWITIHRVALIPGDDRSMPDPDGEWSVEDSGPMDSRHVYADIAPVEVDLLNLPPGQFTRFLNSIDNVPGGTYGKVRLYYSDPKVHFEGAPDTVTVKGTANYHLDIHFVGGGLVIPVTTDPDGGTRVHDVTVTFVLGKDGLKINVNPSKILMRPQVFATVGAVQYVMTGIADNVDKVAGIFDLATSGGESYPVEYDAGTRFFFRDSARWLPVPASTGIPGLNDTAVVDVLGNFGGGGTLLADDILITFPAVESGTVNSGTASSGWLPDNTFLVETLSDNVVVFPMPDHAGAVYDNAASPFGALSEAAIVRGANVVARGYAGSGGIEAFWISVGP